MKIVRLIARKLKLFVRACGRRRRVALLLTNVPHT